SSEEGRVRRHFRGPGDRNHGRAGELAADLARRRGCDTRPQRYTRIRKQPAGQRKGVHRWLVSDRRSGRDGRGRISAAHRPSERDDQPRRREDFSPRRGCSPDEASGGSAGGHLCRSPSKARRGGRCRGRSSRRAHPERPRAEGFRRPPPRGIQSSPEDYFSARNSKGRHRQTAVHRPRHEARACRACRMRICIFGAGAIGGYIGVKLALAGNEGSFVSRGPKLAAIKQKRVKLLSEGKPLVARPRATDDPSELGPQDYVFLTVKAHSLFAIADSIQPLLGSETVLVPAINGIPWWYFYKLPGPYENTRLK